MCTVHIFEMFEIGSFRSAAVTMIWVKRYAYHSFVKMSASPKTRQLNHLWRVNILISKKEDDFLSLLIQCTAFSLYLHGECFLSISCFHIIVTSHHFRINCSEAIIIHSFNVHITDSTIRKFFGLSPALFYPSFI